MSIISSARRVKLLTTDQHFPYSRHSSYTELCEFVSAFKPKEVFPCTVDPETWSEEISMSTLFGHLCSGDNFTHDNQMRHIMNQKQSKAKEKDNEYASSRSSSPALSLPSIHSDVDLDIDEARTVTAKEEDIPNIQKFINRNTMTRRSAAKNEMIKRGLIRKRGRDGRPIITKSQPSCEPEPELHEEDLQPGQDESILGSESEEDEEAYKLRRTRIRTIWRMLMERRHELLFHVHPLPPDLQAEEDE